jgi:hypothetical protein
VLEEMREARLPFGIVGAADVIPDLDADVGLAWLSTESTVRPLPSLRSR